MKTLDQIISAMPVEQQNSARQLLSDNPALAKALLDAANASSSFNVSQLIEGHEQKWPVEDFKSHIHAKIRTYVQVYLDQMQPGMVPAKESIQVVIEGNTVKAVWSKAVAPRKEKNSGTR